MDLSFSAEQQLFADALSRYLEKGYAFEHRRETIASGRWGDAAVWAQLAELGCFGIPVPEAAGGFDGGAVEIGIVMRALGRHLVIEPVLPALVAGTLFGGTHGFEDHVGELIAGSARYAVLFDAELTGDRLTGAARSVPGATNADHLLVAIDDGLFIADMADVIANPVRLLDDSLAADLSLNGVPVRRVETGSDWSSWRGLAQARAQVARGWQALGALEGALDATIDYMRQRKQFRRPLADFQTVQHRVAEMVVAAKEAEVAAQLAATMLDAVDSPADATRAITAATVRIAAAGAIVSENAVQLHGGMGVSDELDIAARFRLLRAYRVQAEAIDQAADRYAQAVVATRAHYRSAVLLEA